jgi:hypothetical protein
VDPFQWEIHGVATAALLDLYEVPPNKQPNVIHWYCRGTNMLAINIVPESPANQVSSGDPTFTVESRKPSEQW